MARPQQITDEAIRRVIDELRLPHRSPSGTAVRHLLQTRFGVRAGTDRVYRLLKAAVPPPAPLEAASATRRTADFAAERDAAVRRAELAEYRERATQDRTAGEIDRLRQRLKSLGVDPFG